MKMSEKLVLFDETINQYVQTENKHAILYCKDWQEAQEYHTWKMFRPLILKKLNKRWDIKLAFHNVVYYECNGGIF